MMKIIFNLSVIYFFIIGFVYSQVPNLAYKNEIQEINGKAFLKNRLFTGIMFEVNAKKIKTLEAYYKDGLKQGDYILRHDNGKTKANYKYSNGEIILGTYQVYNENGEIEIEETYEYNVCSYCNGGGFQSCYNCSGKGKVVCHYCSNGKVRCNKCNGTGQEQQQKKCSKCYGSGQYQYYNPYPHIIKERCFRCNGNKYETFNITCNSCYGQGPTTCSYCNGSSFNNCNSCNGSGKTTQSCQQCGGTGKSTEIIIKKQTHTDGSKASEKEQGFQSNYLKENSQNEEVLESYQIDAPPSFPDGQVGITNFFKKNIQYPEMAKKVGIEGTVFIELFINKYGVVYDTKILKGIGGGCDEEAERVVKFMKWKHGEQNGVPVNVKMSLPIKFSSDR